ncbi:hypothetical protein B9G55_21425 [Saccharibacillus sp. O16]|nr:hypothetical protein B9G55_21425 [Saccharibacillus sp. O16]
MPSSLPVYSRSWKESRPTSIAARCTPRRKKSTIEQEFPGLKIGIPKGGRIHMDRYHQGKRWDWRNRYKKAVLVGILSTMLIPAAIVTTENKASAAATTVYINGRVASGEVMVRNGVTYLTLTDLKALGGYTFRYNKTWKTVTITGGTNNERIVLTLGSKEARRNGQNITLDAAPLSYENKTMMPVRAAAELLGANLKWDSNGNRVMLTKASSSSSNNSNPSPGVPSMPSRPPGSPSGPSGPTAPKPPTPPSM